MEWIELAKTLITAVASVIVALITAGYFRKMQDKNKEKKTREGLMVQIQKDELVHFTLREIRRKYNSDRIYVIQFHNGGTFYTQSPMQKATVTYERCSDGLEKMSEKFQNILVSHHTWYMSEIIGNRLYYTDINEQISDLPTKSWLKNYGNFAHVGVPIYDNSKNLIAVVCMSWVFSDIPTTLYNDEGFLDSFKIQYSNDSNSLKPYLV